MALDEERARGAVVHRANRRTLTCTLAAGLAASMVSGGAHAADIDEVRGLVHFASGAFGMSFDEPELPAGFTMLLLDDSGRTMDATGRYVADDLPLQGSGSLAMGGDAPILAIAIDEITLGLEGRRVEVTVWERPMGTDAHLEIVWSGEMLGSLALVPTGRATDDGWRELGSGPFDMLLGGAVGLPFLLAYDGQLDASLTGSPALDARVHLDALEVRDIGPAGVPDVACGVVDEAATCGPLGACLHGRCADAAALVGPNLAGSIRGDYLERLAVLFETFEGGRASQASMPALSAALEALKDPAPITTTWTSVRAAVEGLVDAHASPPDTGYHLIENLGVCLHLGDADLLPGGGALPMVFSVEGSNPIVDVLQPGDVLTAIDGVAVDAWVEAASRLIRYAGDPAAKAVTIAPAILPAAATVGATLTFSRCNAEGGAPCTAAEVETISVDLAAKLGAPILAGEPPEWAADQAPCDWRFRRFSASPDVGSFAHAFADVVDGVTVFEFNGFPHPTVAGHAAWMDAADEAFANPPALALLDERVGYGGHPLPVFRLGGYLAGPDELYRIDFYPWFAGPVSETLASALRACSATGYYLCGGFHSDDVFAGHPGPGASAGTRLAVLLGMDVSGNDFLTKILAYRKAETRFFGPAPTRGGFGQVMRLAGLGGRSGGSVQIEDSDFSVTAADLDVVFTSSTGIPPHEVVLQKQSDALVGVDTLVEAAMGWVKQ